MYDGGGGGCALVTSKNSTMAHYIMADPFPSFISRFPLQLLQHPRELFWTMRMSKGEFVKYTCVEQYS